MDAPLGRNRAALCAGFSGQLSSWVLWRLHLDWGRRCLACSRTAAWCDRWLLLPQKAGARQRQGHRFRAHFLQGRRKFLIWVAWYLLDDLGSGTCSRTDLLCRQLGSSYPSDYLRLVSTHWSQGYLASFVLAPSLWSGQPCTICDSRA